jgi:hypothetical protein
MYKILVVPLLLLLCISSNAQSTFITPGSYYTTSGHRITGIIMLEAYHGYLYFKQGDRGSRVKVDIDTLKAVMLPAEADSLVVVTEDGKNNRKYFGKFLFATPTTTFFYKFRQLNYDGIKWGVNDGEKTLGQTETKFIPMYLDGNTTRQLTRGNFVDVLSLALADDAALVQKIQNKELKFHDLDTIFDEYKQESTHYRAK